MANIRVLGDVELSGALSFSQNYSDFPPNPAPRTIVVKAGIPYIYTELVDGSGFFTWQPIGIKQASYLHVQGVASTVWTVTHNFNSQNFAYFVYDDAHNLMVANIEMVDDNTCKIKLASAMTGTAVLFSLQYLNSTTLAASQQIDLGGSTLTTTAGVLKVSGNDVAFKTYVDAQDSALSTRIDNIAANIDPAAIDSISELLTAFQSSDGDLSAALTGLSSSTSTAISNEVTRATGVEASLQSQITNIGGSLATVASSGAFADLLNKPTTIAGFGITDAYTKTETDSAIHAIVGAAPAALDTLVEIAAQLANDESAVSALTNVVATKASTTYVDDAIATVTGSLTTSATDLAGEISARTAADLVLQGNIDAETAARTGAISSIQADLAAKANSADVYTKAEVDTSLATKAVAADTYTKAEVDAAIAAAIAAFADTLYV